MPLITVMCGLGAVALHVEAQTTQADSISVAGVIDRYHRALAEGDSAAALELLAPDATILESGGVETREEYRAHHLSSDIQFARAVPSTRSPVQVTVDGNVAWAASTSTTQGTFRDRAINSSGAELMVLSRDTEGWKIRAIHWSSRARRP
jgi:ketosteroid isomerase-like protein